MQPVTCFWLVALITGACAVPIFNVQGEQKAHDMASPQNDVSRRLPANPVGYIFRLALQGRTIKYFWRLQHAQNYLLEIRPSLRRVFRNVENGGDDPTSRHENREKRQSEHEEHLVSHEEHRRHSRHVDHQDGPGGRADQHGSHESHEHRLHSDSHPTDRHNTHSTHDTHSTHSTHDTHNTHKHHESREHRPLSHSSKQIVPFNAAVATSYLKRMTLKQLRPVHNKAIAIWHGIIDGDGINNNNNDNDDDDEEEPVGVEAEDAVVEGQEVENDEDNIPRVDEDDDDDDEQPVNVEAEDADVEGQEVENDEDKNPRVGLDKILLKKYRVDDDDADDDDDDGADKSEEEGKAVNTYVHEDRSRTAVMEESLSLMSVNQQESLLEILGGLMQSIMSHNSTRPSHGQLGVADICCVVG